MKRHENLKRWTTLRKNAPVRDIPQGKITQGRSRLWSITLGDRAVLDNGKQDMENALRANPLSIQEAPAPDQEPARGYDEAACQGAGPGSPDDQPG